MNDDLDMDLTDSAEEEAGDGADGDKEEKKIEEVVQLKEVEP